MLDTTLRLSIALDAMFDLHTISKEKENSNPMIYHFKDTLLGYGLIGVDETS